MTFGNFRAILLRHRWFFLCFRSTDISCGRYQGYHIGDKRTPKRHVNKSSTDFLELIVLWLTFDDINLISPSSTFTVWPAGWRFSILVKGLRCCSTGCTPAPILNCKHAVTLSHCSHGALCNGVLSSGIRSIQSRVRAFQGWDYSIGCVLIAANSFVIWKERAIYQL